MTILFARARDGGALAAELDELMGIGDEERAMRALVFYIRMSFVCRAIQVSGDMRNAVRCIANFFVRDTGCFGGSWMI